MKKSIVFFKSLLLIYSSLAAQDPSHRDTAWGDWPNQEYYNGILQAPVVTGQSSAQIISPTGQKLCFDKKIKIKTLLSSGPVEQCMYLNTSEGYIGILPPLRGSGDDLCDIKTDDPRFTFFVLGLKGNAYTFRNTKKNTSIEHWVSTGNTQTHQVNMTSLAGAYILHKKTERRGYCDDKIKTWAYKYDGSNSPVYFLFGQNFPDEITVSSNKFIGNYGVGYQYTDKGLYIIMEMESSNYDCKITDLEEVNICFDPAPFKIAENEFYTQAITSLQRERNKIAADEAKVGTECVSQKMAVINFRKEQLMVQGARINTSQQGNTFQNLPTQQAMAQMIDHAAVTQQTILENQVKICQAEQRMAQSSNETSRQRYQLRISCLQSQNGQLHNLEVQLKALDIQYASEPGKAFAEKAKKFMQGLPRGCN